MSTLSVDVQFGRDPRILESEEVYGGVFDMHGIVLGLNDEGWGSFVGHVDIGLAGKFCSASAR